jgi:hypothetical protein
MSHMTPADIMVASAPHTLLIHTDLAVAGPDHPRYVQLLGRLDGRQRTIPSRRERVVDDRPTHLTIELPRDNGSARRLDLWIVEARRAQGPGTPTWQTRLEVYCDGTGRAKIDTLSAWTTCPPARQADDLWAASVAIEAGGSRRLRD